MTGQKGRLAIVTSEELNHLLERRAAQATGRALPQSIPSFEAIPQVAESPSPVETLVDQEQSEAVAPAPRRPEIKQKNPRNKVQIEGNVLDTFHKFQGE